MKKGLERAIEVLDEFQAEKEMTMDAEAYELLDELRGKLITEFEMQVE